MGRNQYDITDDDLRELHLSSLKRHAMTPAERAAEAARASELREQVMAVSRERNRQSREAKTKREAEKQVAQKALIEKANKVFRAAGLGELSTKSIDPHFSMEHWQYLQTPLWTKIRRRVLKRDEGLCRVCGEKATEVHHRSYEYDVIVGLDDEGCISICSPCHQRIEFSPDGTHRSVEQKEEILAALLKRI